MKSKRIFVDKYSDKIMNAHITKISKTYTIRPDVVQAHERGSRVVSDLPEPVRQVIQSSIKGEIRAGICADFDNTLVPTDEKKRVFAVFGGENDTAGNRDPFCGLSLLGMPTGVISGNTTEYVGSRCIEPVRDYILDSPVNRDRLPLFSAYALNGGFITLFEDNGSEDLKAMNAFNLTRKMDPKIAAQVTRVMQEALRASITGPVTIPIAIRSGKTLVSVFTPFFENRSDVQLCLTGVPEDIRARLIESIKAGSTGEVLSAVTIMPGGQYSIDCSPVDIQKWHAGLDFSTRFDLDHLFYFGDAVHEGGNDYSMIHAHNAFVFAVNKDKSSVPSHERVFYIGSGPKATYDWLTWYLLEKANHMIRNCEQEDTVWKVLSYINFWQETGQ